MIPLFIRFLGPVDMEVGHQVGEVTCLGGVTRLSIITIPHFILVTLT